MKMNLISWLLCSEPPFKNVKFIISSFPMRSIHNKSKTYSKYYEILELPDNADQDSVRRAFINLCKKYHPDSGTPSANAAKFQEIDDAYRSLQNKFAEERWSDNECLGEYGLYYDEKKRTEQSEVKIFDIKHNAPQHRQYLSYHGVGSGTPSQRERQYANYQRMNAIQNVYSHRIKKLSEESIGAEQTLIIQDKNEAKKIKTRYGMERLVEDLIQESMAKGEFDNLKGAGKPLPQSNYNPYVDFVTHKMNQVMIDNGFVPEWITLQKEINDDTHDIKKILAEERRKVGCLPLSTEEENNWESALERIRAKVNGLNKKIDKFNLVVPILDKQLLHFNLEKESSNVLEGGVCEENSQRPKYGKCETGKQGDLLDFFNALLGNR